MNSYQYQSHSQIQHEKARVQAAISAKEEIDRSRIHREQVAKTRVLWAN